MPAAFEIFSYNYMMSITELHLLEQNLLQYINERKMSKVFAMMSLYDFFEGYQGFQREFLHDKPKGEHYKSFKEFLIFFIQKQINSAAGKNSSFDKEQNEKEAMLWFKKSKRLYTKKDRILAYDQAIACKPDFAEAYFERGSVKESLIRYQAAFDDYTQAIRYKPDYADAYYWRGHLYFFILREYQAAISDFTQAILYNTFYNHAYLARALVYEQSKQYKEAIADYHQYLQIKSDYALSYDGIARCYSFLQDKENVLQYLQKVIQLNAEYKQKISTNKAFDWLRADADFQKLVA